MESKINKNITEKVYFYFSLGFYYFSAGNFSCKKNIVLHPLMS